MPTRAVNGLATTSLPSATLSGSAAKARGATLDTLTKEDFPLPTVTKRIAAARNFLEDGRGIYQFRGIKVDGYSKDDLRLLYWGFGRHDRSRFTVWRDDVSAQLSGAAALCTLTGR